MRKPLSLSVLMPVYNAESYLEAAVESILNQTYSEFEFIVIDDGSTDSSLKILKRYASEDDRIQLVSRENKGLVVTLNQGLDLCKGRFIARMDADDISYPSRLEKQVEYLIDNPGCVAVGSRVLLIDADGDPIREFSELLDHDSIDSSHIACQGGSRICHPTVMIRKKALIDIGNYRAEFIGAEDLDLFLRLGEVGLLANLPETLLAYRQHIESIGYSRSRQQRYSAKRAVAEAYKRRGLKGRPIVDKHAHGTEEDPSIAEIHRKWSWWALSAGNLKTARKYAFKATWKDPFSFKTLKLLACVARGY